MSWKKPFNISCRTLFKSAGKRKKSLEILFSISFFKVSNLHQLGNITQKVGILEVLTGNMVASYFSPVKKTTHIPYWNIIHLNVKGRLSISV